MTMLAEVIDAVIGIDTRRDSHEVEIADAAGKPIAALRISNDSGGFARLLAAIAKVAPGPRVVASAEGTRSYGIGLARALAAAGVQVLEAEQPSRKQRRGKGKSDPIGAHLAVLAALRLEAGRVPVPRADGDREALRILLVARQELATAATGQASRLRALLLAGDDTDRRAARKTLSKTALAALAGRELPAAASREQAIRQAEITRLALTRPSPLPAQRQPGPAAGHRRGHRPPPHQPVWDRARQRRPGHRQLLSPRPVPQMRPHSPRSAHQPHPGQQR
jgi:transposase